MASPIQLRPLDVRQIHKWDGVYGAQWQWQLHTRLSQQVVSQLAVQE